MEVLDRDTIEKFLTLKFKEIAVKKNFVQEKEYPHVFRFTTADRTDFITFNGIKTYHQYFYTLPVILRNIKMVEGYWSDLSKKINIQYGPYFSTIDIHPTLASPNIVNNENYDKIYRSYKGVATEGGINEFMDWGEEFMDTFLFPSAEKYLDLREIDKYVNAEIKYKENVQGFLGTDGTEFKRIVIARLTGNPIYDELVFTYRGYYDWYHNKGKEPGSEFWGNYPEVFEILFERLRDVKPLEDPILK